MRILQLGEDARSKVDAVIDFASRPENHYVLGKTDFVPGDRSEYVTFLDTYRCVYTVTVLDGQTFRHLSVSVPGMQYPNLVAVCTIADMFGFTGAEKEGDFVVGRGPDWDFALQRLPYCAVVVQRLPQEIVVPPPAIDNQQPA